LFHLFFFYLQPPPDEHTGHIDCHCGHHANETPSEARTGGRYHLHGSCFWSCCGADWDNLSCKTRVVCNSLSPLIYFILFYFFFWFSVYLILILFFILPLQPPPDDHSGHIDCHCAHHANETPAELRKSHHIHLNSSCFWSCCGARWDNPKCTKPKKVEPAVRVKAGNHDGFIDCHCGHHTNQTAKEFATDFRTHLDTACFWSCCGARWDIGYCRNSKLRCVEPEPEKKEERKPVCEKGHPLHTLKVADLIKEASAYHHCAICNGCRRRITPEETDYHCYACNYDLCPECLKKMFGDPAPYTLKCDKGHPLHTLTVADLAKEVPEYKPCAICNGCRRKIMPPEIDRHCYACNYDLCPECAEKKK